MAQPIQNDLNVLHEVLNTVEQHAHGSDGNRLYVCIDSNTKQVVAATKEQIASGAVTRLSVTKIATLAHDIINKTDVSPAGVTAKIENITNLIKNLSTRRLEKNAKWNTAIKIVSFLFLLTFGFGLYAMNKQKVIEQQHAHLTNWALSTQQATQNKKIKYDTDLIYKETARKDLESSPKPGTLITKMCKAESRKLAKLIEQNNVWSLENIQAAAINPEFLIDSTGLLPQQFMIDAERANTISFTFDDETLAIQPKDIPKNSRMKVISNLLGDVAQKLSTDREQIHQNPLLTNICALAQQGTVAEGHALLTTKYGLMLGEGIKDINIIIAENSVTMTFQMLHRQPELNDEGTPIQLPDFAILAKGFVVSTLVMEIPRSALEKDPGELDPQELERASRKWTFHEFKTEEEAMKNISGEGLFDIAL